MNIILKILVFSIVLFLYIHIHFHLKTSDDFEVFELTDVSKDKLEEVCDLRQPLTFLVNIENLNEFNIDNLKNKYSSFELNLRNKDNNDKNDISDEEHKTFPETTTEFKDGQSSQKLESQSKDTSIDKKEPTKARSSKVSAEIITQNKETNRRPLIR